MRRTLPAFLALLLLAGPACQKRGLGPAVRVEAAPGFKLATLPVIGFLCLGKIGPEIESLRSLEPMLEEALQTTVLTAVIVPRAECERRAAEHGVATQHQEICDFWRDAKKIDKFKVAELCAATGLQGVLVGTVEEWTQNRVSWGAEGTSSSRVAVSLEIFAAGEGRPAWLARASQTLESQEYEPGTIATGPVDPGAERVARRSGSLDPNAARAQKLTPEPPPLEDVGRLVVAALSQALAE